MKIVFLLASFWIQTLRGAPHCCTSKNVGGLEYILQRVADTSPYNCLDNCIYTKSVDPGHSYCFAAGDEKVLCTDEGLENCKNGSTVVDGPFGGTSGTPFTDSSYAVYGYPTQMQIWAGAIIDAIKIRYGATEAPQHGGDGGNHNTVNLHTGEKITAIQGNYGSYGEYLGTGEIVICQLTFTTNLGRIFGPFGTTCDTPFNSVNPGCNLSFVSGRSDHRFLLSLSFHWCC